MSEMKKGMIYQIDPSKDENLPAQFVVATEFYDWGIQGYLLLDQPENGKLVRYQGKAFLRPTWDKIVPVGQAEWIWEAKEEKDGSKA